MTEVPSDRTDLAPARRELRATALRAAEGDAQAFTALIRATSRDVWWACARLVDRASAEDLAQETFLRAFRSLAGYRGDADPLRWLLTIARRVCADEIGRRQRSRRVAARVGAEPSVLVPGPAIRVELAEALARLSEDRRDAFLLTSIAGLSYAEAAAALECPIGTIRSRVARARADLLVALELTSGSHADVVTILDRRSVS